MTFLEVCHFPPLNQDFFYPQQYSLICSCRYMHHCLKHHDFSGKSLATVLNTIYGVNLNMQHCLQSIADRRTNTYCKYKHCSTWIHITIIHSTCHGGSKKKQLVLQCKLSIHWRFQTLSSWTGRQGQRRLEAAHPQSTSGRSHQALIGTPPNLGQTAMERRKLKASSEILSLSSFCLAQKFGMGPDNKKLIPSEHLCVVHYHMKEDWLYCKTLTNPLTQQSMWT